MQAIIEVKGHQYLVKRGDKIRVNKLSSQDLSQPLSFSPLLVINEKETIVGQPTVEDYQVEAKVLEDKVLDKKVVAIRFKAKKRVHKRRGHRQQKTLIEIVDLVAKKAQKS